MRSLPSSTVSISNSSSRARFVVGIGVGPELEIGMTGRLEEQEGRSLRSGEEGIGSRDIRAPIPHVSRRLALPKPSANQAICLVLPGAK